MAQLFVQRALDACRRLASDFHEGVQINNQRHLRGPAIGIGRDRLRIQSTAGTHGLQDHIVKRGRILCVDQSLQRVESLDHLAQFFIRFDLGWMLRARAEFAHRRIALGFDAGLKLGDDACFRLLPVLALNQRLASRTGTPARLFRLGTLAWHIRLRAWNIQNRFSGFCQTANGIHHLLLGDVSTRNAKDGGQFINDGIEQALDLRSLAGLPISCREGGHGLKRLACGVEFVEAGVKTFTV